MGSKNLWYYNSILNRFKESKDYNKIYANNVDFKNAEIRMLGGSSKELKIYSINSIGNLAFFVDSSYLISYLSAAQANIEFEIDEKYDSQIINMTFKHKNLYNILINYDVVLNNNNSRIKTKDGANYQEVVWIVTGNTVIDNTILKGTVISYGNIDVFNSKVKGRLFSINGSVTLNKKVQFLFRNFSLSKVSKYTFIIKYIIYFYIELI